MNCLMKIPCCTNLDPSVIEREYTRVVGVILRYEDWRKMISVGNHEESKSDTPFIIQEEKNLVQGSCIGTYP